MRYTVVILAVMLATVATAQAQPSKYGFKGNAKGEVSQEVAVEANAENIENIEPAAGNVQEQINETNSNSRRFKNK